ncbi:enoyl-CoA hydratase/isomerase family protein [Pseudochelatococcus sp. B33]
MEEKCYETVEVSAPHRGIVHVILNRPDNANALNRQLIVDLCGALSACANDDRVRLVVVRSRGRHFCAGADTKEHSVSPGIVDLLEEMDNFPKPIICVVQGGCVGGGIAIAACCDIVLATEDAFFTLPEIRLGIAPSKLLPYFIRIFGHRNFRQYGLTAERIAAEHAVKLGIARESAPAHEMERRVDEIADQLLHAAPIATRVLKRRLAAWQSPVASEMRTAPPDEAELREGVSAMSEKRKPSWYP